MKKLLIICLVLLLCIPALGTKITDAADSRDDIERKIDGLSETGRGASWYVYSGATGNAKGNNWTNACLTANAAIDLASAFDTIHFGQLHNESLIAADGVDADKEGLYFKGYGRGTAMPTFDYDHADGEFVIGAPNIRIENFRFRVSANAVTKALEVEALGDDYEIVECEFGFPETSTDEFTSAIVVVTAGDNGLIEECLFDAALGNAAADAIAISGVSGIMIRDNFFTGDYSIGCINNKVDSDNLYVMHNTLINGILYDDGGIGTVKVIGFANDTGGMIAHNTIVSDVTSALLMVVADDVVRINNIVTDTDGDEFSGTIEAGPSGSLGGTATSSTISGHIDG